MDSLKAYFQKLDDMPIKELVQYLKDIGIEVEKMEETRTVFMKIVFKSGRKLEFETTETEVGWLYDKMFGREQGIFQNFSGGIVVNILEIESLKHFDYNSEEE